MNKRTYINLAERPTERKISTKPQPETQNVSPPSQDPDHPRSNKFQFKNTDEIKKNNVLSDTIKTIKKNKKFAKVNLNDLNV